MTEPIQETTPKPSTGQKGKPSEEKSEDNNENKNTAISSFSNLKLNGYKAVFCRTSTTKNLTLSSKAKRQLGSNELQKVAEDRKNWIGVTYVVKQWKSQKEELGRTTTILVFILGVIFGVVVNYIDRPDKGVAIIVLLLVAVLFLLTYLFGIRRAETYYLSALHLEALLEKTPQDISSKECT